MLQHATKDSIRDLLIESSRVNFENNLSINQNFTFTYAEKVFKEKGLRFGQENKKNLGIINDKNMYTNLGLLILDECPYTIKMVVYSDNTKTEFLDTKETSPGSLLYQLEETYSYLKLNNKVKSKIVPLWWKHTNH